MGNFLPLQITQRTDKCFKSLVYILNKFEDRFNLAISPWTAYFVDYICKKTEITLNDSHWLSFLKSWLITLQPSSGLWPTKGLFSHNVIACAIETISGEVIAASCTLYNQEFIIMSKLVSVFIF